MRRQFTDRVGLTVAVAVGVLVTATALQAQDPEPEAATECEVQVAEPVSVSEEPVVVEATLSEAIGEALTAVVQDESGVEFVSAEPAEEEGAVNLTLNTSEAVSGEWTISLTGESGECAGTFTVSAAQEAPAN